MPSHLMGSCYVTQAGPELLDSIDPPTLAFQVLGFLWEYNMVQQEII
uniref:Uncharacterized protein n=1 Tax=Mandrillus leucophaeus TaxID=9568 RepID=A0A2K5Z0L9_MANLE